MINSKSWHKAVLENVPHGEEGQLQCSMDDAMTLTRLLLRYGYAVCITDGDFGDDVAVHWLYAGGEDLNFADYGNVVFSSVDYLESYVDAINNAEEE